MVSTMRSCFPIDGILFFNRYGCLPISVHHLAGDEEELDGGVNMAPQPLSQNLFTSSTCCSQAAITANHSTEVIDRRL